MGNWIALGLKLMPMIVEAISWVEKYVLRKGKAKQDAAIQLCLSMLGIAEATLDRSVLEDSEVEEAARKTIDAIVALQNLITKKSGAERTGRDGS